MMAFDPTILTYLQKLDYTCAVGSTIWMLRSLGIDVTPEDAHDAMVPKYVNSNVGLLNADGSGIVEVLRDRWGVGAVNDAAATFDDVAAVAGRQPTAMGLRNWAMTNPQQGHWSAVRGFDGDRLILANPGGTGPTFGHQTLTRAEFDARGPASMVTVPIGANGQEPAPMTKPDPWKWFSVDNIYQITQCPLPAIRENWPRLVEQLAHCKINTRPTQVAMIGTVAIETARTFAPVREAFWLTEDWRRANLTYYPFYGRGYIQLTHESNYAKYGPKIAALWGTSPDQPDFNLVGEPDRALGPDISAAVSALYFRDHGGDGQNRIPMAAAIGNWQEVRRLVQGGTAGLEDFTKMANALTALPQPEPAPVFDRAAVAAGLRALLARHDAYDRAVRANLARLLAMAEAA